MAETSEKKDESLADLVANAEEEGSFVDGVIAARRLYAQAWCDATGESIEDIEFTIGFLRDRVAKMRESERPSVEELLRRIDDVMARLEGMMSEALAFDEGYRQAVADLEFLLDTNERKARLLLGRRRKRLLDNVRVVREALKMMRGSPNWKQAFGEEG